MFLKFFLSSVSGTSIRISQKEELELMSLHFVGTRRVAVLGEALTIDD